MRICTNPLRRPTRRARRGGALVVVAFATLALAGLSFSLLTLSSAGARERRGARETIGARYVCEAALADALLDVQSGGSGARGSAGNPVAYGGASYWVQATPLPGDLVQLTATGEEDRAGARMELTLRRVTSNLFEWGAFGDQAMSMDSNARVDSYDSSLGTYASQAVNGSGKNTYAGSNGDVGSNGNVLLEQNTVVHGDAVPGPGSSTTLLGSSVVTGSTAPNTSTVEMPPINLPAIPSSGNLTVPGAVPLVLSAGDYRYGTFQISTGGSVHVEGPSRLVFDDFLMASNTQFIVDASGGPVEIWVEDDFEMDSNTLIASTTYTPADVRFSLLSDNVVNPTTNINLSNVTFDSNAKLYGVVYAPNAAIEVDSNFELFGSLVALSVDLDSNSRIHYDMALQSAAINTGWSYQPLCWRVLPYQP